MKDKKCEEKNDGKQKTLTSLFYDIIKNMKIVRVTFIIVNVINIYYIIWFILWTLRIMNHITTRHIFLRKRMVSRTSLSLLIKANFEKTDKKLLNSLIV